MRHSLAFAATLVLFAGCADGPDVPTDGGALELNIAPLSLPGVADAVWDVAVTTTNATVWEARLTASGYGAGGSVSYVGPCDASAGDNTVTLSLVGIYASPVASPGDYGDAAPTGALDVRNPGQLSRDFTCLADADTAVSFDVSVVRPATQGFFDVGVSFSDLFCSAKYDCAAGDLLFDTDGDRGPTQVLGFTCVAGSGDGVETTLYLDDVVVTCVAETATIDPSAGPGNLNIQGTGWTGVTFAGGFDRLFQVAVNRGEQVAGVDGAYWTVSLGVTSSLTGCTLTTTGTADDAASTGAGDDGEIASDEVYPVVSWDIDLGTCTGAHALDANDSDVVTEYLGLGDAHTFPHATTGAPGSTTGGSGSGTTVGGPSTPAAPSVGTSGSNQPNYVRAITTDTEGNIYLVGTFTGAVTFGDGVSATAFNQYDTDIFVAKRSAAGTWIWAVNGGGNTVDAGYDIDYDPQTDTLAIGGTCFGEAYFGAYTITPVDNDTLDVCVARLDTDGNWLGAIGGGSQGTDRAWAVSVHDGRIYVGGIFGQTATFGALDPMTSADTADGFIAAVDIAGDGSLTWRWARQAKAAHDGNTYAIDARTIGGSPVVAATGWHQGTPIGGYLDGVSHPSSVSNAYVVALDGDDGSTTWAHVVSSEFTGSSGKALVLTPDGTVYSGGMVYGTSHFGDTDITQINGNSSAAYVAKSNASGFVTAWSGGGSLPSNGRNEVLSLALGVDGELYVGGSFVGTDASFGDADLSSNGQYDAFVARLEVDGPGAGWVWAEGGGGSGYDTCYGVVQSSVDVVSWAGTLATPGGTISGVNLSTSGNSTVYFAAASATE